MMTLDEAIQHCEEQVDLLEESAEGCDLYDPVEKQIACKSGECAAEHRQLAEWLKDYKRLLEQNPCEDAISRQAVLDQAMDYGSNTYLVPVNSIKAQPPVNPQPKTGHWIIVEVLHGEWEGTKKYACDKCGEKVGVFKSNYCPNCGVKMEIKE